MDEALHLKDAAPIPILGIISIPQHLDKSGVEGLGKCCLYNKNGELIEANYKTNAEGQRVRIGGSGLVSNGNDECKKWMKDDPNAAAAGLWWCVGPFQNCKMDWWRM